MWSILFLLLGLMTMFCKQEVLVDFPQNNRRVLIMIMNITTIISMILTVIFMITDIR